MQCACLRQLSWVILGIAWKVAKYRVFSGPYFPEFGLNTDRHGVSPRIQSKCWKIRTRKNTVFGHFSRSAVLRYKSDVAKHEWTALSFNFDKIRDLSNRCKFFSTPVAEYASISTRLERLKLIYYSLTLSFSNCYMLSSFLIFTCIYHFRNWQQLFWYPIMKNRKATSP